MEVDPFEFVKTIALARILMPGSYIGLSAGREQMSDEMQALCFLAGTNSIFYGEKLLTADNPIPENHPLLFERLGLERLQQAFASLIFFFCFSNANRYLAFRSLKSAGLKDANPLTPRQIMGLRTYAPLPRAFSYIGKGEDKNGKNTESEVRI